MQNYGPNIIFTTIDQNPVNFVANRSKCVKNITKSYINMTKLIKIIWAKIVFYDQIYKYPGNLLTNIGQYAIFDITAMI